MEMCSDGHFSGLSGFRTESEKTREGQQQWTQDNNATPRVQSSVPTSSHLSGFLPFSGDQKGRKLAFITPPDHSLLSRMRINYHGKYSSLLTFLTAEKLLHFPCCCCRLQTYHYTGVPWDFSDTEWITYAWG